MSNSSPFGDAFVDHVVFNKAEAEDCWKRCTPEISPSTDCSALAGAIESDNWFLLAEQSYSAEKMLSNPIPMLCAVTSSLTRYAPTLIQPNSLNHLSFRVGSKPFRKLVVELEAREQLFNKTIESDIDKLSNVLKKRYASPKEVAQALDGCGDLNLSGSLVEQVIGFDLVGTQTGYRDSPESYNLMVDILGKADEFQHMWELIEVMSSLDGYISLVTMAKVIRRVARAHLYEEAIAAFKGMERLGISKDVSGLNILLDKLVKENSVEHAQEVFLEFRDCEDHKFQHFSTWVVQKEKALKLLKKMDLKTYAALLKMCCKKRRMKEMISKDMVPQDSVYNRLKKELQAKEKQDIEKLFLRLLIRIDLQFQGEEPKKEKGRDRSWNPLPCVSSGVFIGSFLFELPLFLVVGSFDTVHKDRRALHGQWRTPNWCVSVEGPYPSRKHKVPSSIMERVVGSRASLSWPGKISLVEVSSVKLGPLSSGSMEQGTLAA
uniref:Pentatricopeptide repeat-containing protein n=1 Tax=Cannabis sativa TaxID=3483 RepID=A0A803QA63_CANSA